MSEGRKNTLPAVAAKGAGKRDSGVRHGVYSWLRSKRGTTDRASKATMREVGKLLDEFEAEHTVDGTISPGAGALIRGTCEAEGVVMLIGLYLRKYGVLDGRAAKRGSLELSPLLSKSWLAYQNTIRQNVLALEALKASYKREGGTLDLQTYIAEFDRKKAQGAEAAGSPAQEPRDEQIEAPRAFRGPASGQAPGPSAAPEGEVTADVELPKRTEGEGDDDC